MKECSKSVSMLEVMDNSIATSFYCAMLCIRSTSHGPVSVSVCLSVTSRCSTKTAKGRITQTTPHDSPWTVFLLKPNSGKFDRGHPLRGRQMQVGWVKIGDFQQITSYISETVKRRITQTTPHDSPRTLVFWCQRFREIRPGHPLWGHKMQVG